MNKITCLLIVLLLFQPVTLSARTNSDSHEAQNIAFKTAPITITTAKKTHHFTVELALSPEQQSLGLMHRTSLKKNHGMLFLWPQDEPVSMWMKDTIIPLDMLFIDASGNIIYIARNTKPLSLETISAGVSVRAVLELPAGTTDSKKITINDHVDFSKVAL